MTTQKLLDNDWAIAITEEIQANPHGIAFSVEPALMGQYDCECGLPCEPYERGYRTLADVEDYLWAYKDTAAAWASTVQGINDSMGVDIEAELELLLDGIEDENFWRMGGNW